MLEVAGLNYWAIAAAWLINVVVGALWYSPLGFAKRWQAHTGVDILAMPEREATAALGFVTVSALVQAGVLAIVINSVGATTAVDGLVTGLVLWFGLTAATTVGTTFYQRLGWRFWWLTTSYFLLVMTANGAILGTWR